MASNKELWKKMCYDEFGDAVSHGKTECGNCKDIFNTLWRDNFDMHGKFDIDMDGIF